MSDDPLAELLAAVDAVNASGSAKNRLRLRAAFNALPRDRGPLADSLGPPLPPRQWSFTPHVMAALARSAELADASNDLYIRLHHLEFAIEEIQQTKTQPQ